MCLHCVHHNKSFAFHVLHPRAWYMDNGMVADRAESRPDHLIREAMLSDSKSP